MMMMMIISRVNISWKNLILRTSFAEKKNETIRTVQLTVTLAV